MGTSCCKGIWRRGGLSYIWGVQFHPEFNKDVALAYINELESSIAREGYNIEFLRASVEEHSYGVVLLKRFLEL